MPGLPGRCRYLFVYLQPTPGRLRLVLQVLKTANLTIKLEKYHFGFEQLRFLGYGVSAQRVLPDSDKIVDVSSFRRPTTKAVQGFLGLCSYYRRFVEGFSRIVEPLTLLARDDTPFLWGREQEAAFLELRNRLQDP